MTVLVKRVMAAAWAIALLALLLCGCAKTEDELASASWREVARWEADGVTWTEAFQIDSPTWRVSWDTQPDTQRKKRFRVEVHEAVTLSGDLIDDVVRDDGPDKGSKTIHRQGKFYIVIDARQPFVVSVEVPE